MSQVHIHPINAVSAFAEFRARFEARHSRLHVDRVDIDGDKELRTDFGGTKVFWLFAGAGEVFLKSGYRTKEGDGEPLREDYLPDVPEEVLLAALSCLRDSFASLCTAAQGAVHSILSRKRRDKSQTCFSGDIAGDIWKLEHAPRPWSPDNNVNGAINFLFSTYRQHGYSEKQSNSYETVMRGDQLIVAGDDVLQVRGKFSCLTVEHVERRVSHVPAVMRLRHLKDTSGGCNSDFDPFRRLPLTWYVNLSGETDDGVNFVNSHVVNIAQETSPTHFHPERPVNGGLPQDEIYLVLDSNAYRLNTYGRQPSLVTYPDLHNLTQVEDHMLAPGDLVYIPAGTGHRGMDVFANVITIPGFKPHNEYYLDKDIADAAGDSKLLNGNLLHLKNYADLGALL